MPSTVTSSSRSASICLFTEAVTELSHYMQKCLDFHPSTVSLLCMPLFSAVLGFPDSSVGKESAYNAGDLGLIPGLGKSPGEGKVHPLQYSGLENSMDRGAWQIIVLEFAKNQTQLSNFLFSHFLRGFPDGTSSKEPACQCRRH